MARFKIISKDGGTIRYEGKPKYVGTYLRPSYLEFSEIASSVPIAWEVGDYVEYSRTGMTYRLYSIPQATKNARKGSHGRAFTYSGVQLFAATKELDIALFRDLVSNDNNIHFSTSPDVVTFEDVYGIARRIQECMDDLYPGRWEIRVADFDESEDAEIISKISEAKDFALSGGTCLDALSKIYELWQDVGWIHTHENGKEVITIGYTSKRIDANTSESYLYGKGNGLTAIKKTQINRDEFATRLYVYGSERNLPSRYYNTKGILNADSVDIRNLMLPLDKWGTTDNLPDARKAYLENAEAVARFGVIPKTHYFDSEDAGADIYPSISGMTIGMLRKVLDDMGQTKYYPSESDYPDPSQRIDEVRFCYNPEDDGAINIEPIRHSEQEFAEISEGVVSSTQFIVDNKFLFSEEFTLEEGEACEMVVSPHISGYVEDRGYSSVVVSLRLQDSRYTSSIGHSAVQKAYAKKDGDRWTFDLPEVRFNYAQSPIRGFGCKVYITIEGNGASNENSAYVLNAGTVDFSLYPIQSETFVIRLNELGFNIDEMAKVGNGKTISMKTGACAGRSFKIEKSRHKSFYWDITCRRQKDSTLGQIFPNSSYQIQAGDKFVLVDIGMPESYIRVAMERLLSEGEKLLSRASKIQNHYEPSIDAKVMMESGRTLREGMFMEITDEDVVDNTTDYILIDSLSIVEDESSIPTYKVTLKERRKVTYKGTPSATSTTDTQTSVGGSENEEGFATETFVTEQINILKGLWHIDESTGYLVTDHQVHIKKSLLIDGDVASGGEGENTPVEGTVTRIDVDGTPYNPDSLGVIDLTEAFKNVKVDLSNYYTKYEVNELIDQIKAGDIDLANYYTKEEIDRKGFLTSASLVGYATTGYVSEAISNLNIGQFATKTALAATVEALSAEIGKKANADDVADTYATKTALTTVDNRLISIESYFATSEDAGNQIDKWNEIVAFLNATEGTTLSGILAAYYSKTEIDGKITTINAEIAKRALQSDFTALATRVDTAEGNITSLTNGKADKSELSKYVLLEKASQTIKGDITIEGNLVITGDVASGGEGGNTSAEGTVTGVTVSGVDYTSVEAGLLDLTDLMANYALKTASTKVSVSPSLSSGKSIGVISVDGVGTTLYAPATYAWSEIADRPTKLSQFTDDVVSGKYLPLTGGTVSGVVLIKNSATNPLQIFSSSGVQSGTAWFINDTPKSWFGYDANGTTMYDYAHAATLGIATDGVPKFNNYTLYHSGNFNPANYLPLSGGTISHNYYGAFELKRNEKNYDSVIKFSNINDGLLGYIGISGSATTAAPKIPYYSPDGINVYPLIHSGNVGEYALKIDGSNAMTAGKYINWQGSNLNGEDYKSFGYGIRLLSYDVASNNYRGGLSVGTRYGFQLTRLANADLNSLTVRFNAPNNNNTWGDWKTIAFTDSNVASAQALTHSNGTVGATVGADGKLCISQQGIFNNNGTLSLFDFNGSSLNVGYSMRNSYVTDIYGGSIRMFTGNAVRMLINSSGNVTIGDNDLASTKYKLAVDGGIAMFGTGNATYPSWIRSTATNGFEILMGVDANQSKTGLRIGWRNWSDVAMVIAPSGNVGVGTDGPAYNLDVAGTGRFTDSLLVSGLLTANSGATITGDVTINGNLIVSGDVASGGQGQDTPSEGGEVLGALRLTGYLEGMGENTTQSEMNAIGLTSEVIDNIFNGKYTIIIDDQGNGFSYNTYHSTTNDYGTINLNQGIIGQLGYSFQIKKRTDGYYDIYMIEL